jgi:hypothetical protein
VRRIDTATNLVSKVGTTPSGYQLTSPPREVSDGILVMSIAKPYDVAVWNPKTDALRTVVSDVSEVVASSTSRIAYLDANHELRIGGVATGASVPVVVGGNAVHGGGRGSFSPDGAALAAFADVAPATEGIGEVAQLVVADSSTGTGRLIAHEPLAVVPDQMWASWQPDGDAVVFGGASGTTWTVERRGVVATPLPVASNSSWTVLEDVRNGALIAGNDDHRVTARWSPMAVDDQAFAPGAFISTVVDFHGTVVAAGSQFGGCGLRNEPSCGAPGDIAPAGIGNPIVWASTGGQPWARVWDPGGVAIGSGAAPKLVVLGDALWLFHVGTPGTLAWRSTDAREWTPQPLPPAMAQNFLVGVVERDGVLVAAMADKSGRGDVVWVSADGVSWEKPASGFGPTAQPSSIAASPDGFTIGGTVGFVGPPTLWTSADALHWTEQSLGKRQGNVSALASAGGEHVAIVTVGFHTEYWRKAESGKWVQARAEPTSSGWSSSWRVLGTRSGFVSIDARPWSWQSSPSGEQWQLVVDGAGPTGMVTTASTTSDGRIVAFVTTDSSSGLRGVARPWLVDLTER